MKDVVAILDFLLDAASRDERTALVTITGSTVGLPRSPGTHMAVSETGQYLGSLSGGCLEPAVAAEARRVISSGRAEQLRFGQGSPFIDIQLPCGGGMDLLLLPDPETAGLRRARLLLAGRQPAVLLSEQDGSLSARPAQPEDQTGWDRGTFLVRHDPNMRLIIAGQSAEVLALARLGLCYGGEVLVLSPDRDLLDAAAALGAETSPLQARRPSPYLRSDPYTAVVLLFHDHYWESELLIQALAQEAFFIGAMGSRNSHEQRLRALAQRDVPAASAARVVGPIGLIKQARDPETLAISALAQIVDRYSELTASPQPAAAWT